MQSADRAHLHVGQKSGLTVQQPVLDAFASSRGSPGGWMTCVYDPSAKDTVALKDSGAGGWASCEASLADDAIVFGAFAFTLGGQHRVAFFSWVGANVSPLKRGKVPLQRGAVYNALEGCCADLSLSSREDAQPGAVAAKLVKLLSNGDVAL